MAITTAITPKEQHQQPFPLSDILRDLAFLRNIDVDLAAVLIPDTAPSDSKRESEGRDHHGVSVDAGTPGDDNTSLLKRSYDFVQAGRAALRILNRGELVKAGETVEQARESLEEILRGLDETGNQE